MDNYSSSIDKFLVENIGDANNLVAKNMWGNTKVNRFTLSKWYANISNSYEIF